MVSNTKTQIAYTLLRREPVHATGAELKRWAIALGALIQYEDLCTSCWAVYSNGVGRQCEGGDCILSEA